MWRPFSTSWEPELSTPYSSTIGSFSSFFIERFISVYNEIWACAPMPFPQLPSMPPSDFMSFFLWWPTESSRGSSHPGLRLLHPRGPHPSHSMGKVGAAHIPCIGCPQTSLGTTWTVTTSAFIMQILKANVLSWNTEVLQEAEAEAKGWFVCLVALITLNIC